MRARIITLYMSGTRPRKPTAQGTDSHDFDTAALRKRPCGKGPGANREAQTSRLADNSVVSRFSCSKMSDYCCWHKNQLGLQAWQVYSACAMMPEKGLQTNGYCAFSLKGHFD